MVFGPKNFWRDVSPRGAVGDLVGEWRQPTPYRWQILGVSIAATFALMMLFLPEEQRAPPEKPTITWITTFAPDRTEQEIIESNVENQKRQDTIRAIREAQEERRRELYRALGRASGMDVDALEKEFRDDEPAAPAAQPSSGASQTPAASARTTGE
jgi:hypothetical protein